MGVLEQSASKSLLIEAISVIFCMNFIRCV
jgi:hypothetical protein